MASSRNAPVRTPPGSMIHAALVPFPIVCFTLALLSDLAFWNTANLMWHNFSSWLLFVGLVMGGVAGIFGVVRLLFGRDVRGHDRAWMHGLGNVLVLALAFLNSLVHAGDGWTGVVPYGIALSAATVAVMLVTVWLGRAMSHSLVTGNRYV